MRLITDPLLVMDAVGSLVILALGIWVWTFRPRGPAILSLGAFCVSFGGAFAIQNTFVHEPPVEAWFLVAEGLLLAAAAVSAVALAFAVAPQTMGSWWRWVALAFVPPVIYALNVGGRPLAGLPLDAYLVFNVGMTALLGGLAGALFLLGRAFSVGTDARERIARTAAAFVPWAGYMFGANLIYATDFWNFVPMMLFLSAAASWLAAAVSGPASRTARNVAWGALAMALVGSTMEGTVGTAGGFGLMRLLTVFILVHAILRHRLLGMEVRLRWTISKTALAGMFVAVFFIASEAAQQFFGARAGNEYLGILAAGSLVFALAPLSRLADRLAEKAVPTTTPSPGREDAFRAALRIALDARSVTVADRVRLGQVADELGLSARRAAEIEAEMVGRGVDTGA